jgi:hypothetical protein
MTQDPILDDGLMELTDPFMRFKSITEYIAQQMKPLICFTSGEDDEIQEACIIVQFEFICIFLCRYLSATILEGTTDPEKFLDIFFKGGSVLLQHIQNKTIPLQLLDALRHHILAPLEKRTPSPPFLTILPHSIPEVLPRTKMWLEALMTMAINKKIPKKMNRMIQSLEVLVTKTRQHRPWFPSLLRDLNVLAIDSKKSSCRGALLQPRWEISRHVFHTFFRIDACFPNAEEKKKAWKSRHADTIFKIIILVFFHIEQILQIFFWLSDDHDQKKAIMLRLFRRKIQRDFLLQKINIAFYLDEFIPHDVLPLLMDDYLHKTPRGEKEIRKKKDRQGSELIYKQNKIYLEKELSVFDKGQSFLTFLYRQQKKHLFLVDVQNICRVSFHMKDNKKINEFCSRPAIHNYLIHILFPKDAMRTMYSGYLSSSYWIMVNKGDVHVNRTTKEITILSHEKSKDPNTLQIRIACFDPVTEMDSFFSMGGDEMDDIFIVKVISDLHVDSQRIGVQKFPFKSIHVLSHDLYSNFTGYTSLLEWSVLHHPSPLGKKERMVSVSNTNATPPLISTTSRSLLSPGLLRGQGRG